MKNIAKILIPLIILLIAFVAADFLYRVSHNPVPGALSSKEASQKALNFINDVALNGQATASLLETTEKSGLYKIRLKVRDQEYESYVTKDAKILFTQGTEITEELANQPNTEEQKFSKLDIPQVQLFVMSFCPYGNQAEELMMPVIELLKDKANIELHYVIYSNYRDGGPNYCLDKENKYCSMHGIQELNQDVREFCVQKYQKDKFWSFVKEINKNCSAKDVDSCWENIAKKVGLNTQQIKTCQKDEALRILAQEVKLNEKYGIEGSPQLVINEAEYQGSRSSEAYKQAICSAFNSQPKECSETLSNEGGSASGGCE